MGAKDDTEKVLRQIHVLFSKAVPYQGSAANVVVNKTQVMGLLKELNTAVYAMMDEYELTQVSRDRAEREQKKRGEEIIAEAQHRAEDVYAASMIYTDRALVEIQDIMKKATKQMEEIASQTQESLEKETRNVRSNQSELKGQLQDLIDTQKYLHIIEDENKRIEKEKAMASEEPPEPSPYADIKPEIRVNQAYFTQTADLEQNEAEAIADSVVITPEAKPVTSEDLDREYFDWKAPEREEKRAENTVEKVLSIFGRKPE